jgi:hypothetical protein
MSRKPMPDAARLRQMNTLLQQALDLPESERAAWLQALPAEHRTLAPLLTALLLRAEVETDTFMRQPVELPEGLLRRRGPRS